jgi:hypothetical protein
VSDSPVDLYVRWTRTVIKIAEILGWGEGVFDPMDNIARWMLVAYHDTRADQWVDIECMRLDARLELLGKGKHERRRKVLGFLLRMNSRLIEIGEPATGHLLDRNVLMVVAAELRRGVPEFATEHNDQRKAAAASKQARWQRQADAIWARSPRLTRTVVAGMIDPKRSNYIRRKITPTE